MSERYIVVLSRSDFDTENLAWLHDSVTIGPFRSLERAEKRAATIRRAAEKYEDPVGVTGPDNALDVRVQPIRAGQCSADVALSYLYEGI